MTHTAEGTFGRGPHGVDLSRRRRGLARSAGAGPLLTLLAVMAACGDFDYGLLDLSPSGGSSGGGAGGSNGGGGAVPPVHFRVASVRDLGELDRDPVVLARDGGASAVFDGRSVWMYGDTLFDVGHGFSGQSNSFTSTDDFDARSGIDFPRSGTATSPAPLLLETEAERAFNAAHALSNCQAEPCGARWALWPQSLVVDAARRRALVFYTKVYAKVELLDFRSAGDFIAVWDDVRGPPPDRRTDLETGEPPVVFAEGERSFANARVIKGETLYAYGCENRDLSKACRVARVPIGRALEPNAWSYYVGNDTWGSDAAAAVPVIDGNDIMSVAYNRYLGAYLAVYSPPLTNVVMMRTAPRPEGPWSDAVRAFATRVPTELWVYDSQAHPEYEEERGRVQYVTYSLSIGTLRSQMRLVRVELALGSGA